MKVVKRRDRISRAGGEVVFVVHDDPDDVRSILLDGLDVPYPVVYDLERHAYGAWGLQRAPWWRIWLDPSVWTQYASLLLGGEHIRGSGRDLRQLGGDFVIAPGGAVDYARPQQRDDRPPAGELVDRLERLVG